jgi:hypothetical protein
VRCGKHVGTYLYSLQRANCTVYVYNIECIMCTIIIRIYMTLCKRICTYVRTYILQGVYNCLFLFWIVVGACLQCHRLAAVFIASICLFQMTFEISHMNRMGEEGIL